jgi:hypothetical protein
MEGMMNEHEDLDASLPPELLDPLRADAPAPRHLEDLVVSRWQRQQSPRAAAIPRSSAVWIAAAALAAVLAAVSFSLGVRYGVRRAGQVPHEEFIAAPLVARLVDHPPGVVWY